jgi:hypothetical protein
VNSSAPFFQRYSTGPAKALAAVFLLFLSAAARAALPPEAVAEHFGAVTNDQFGQSASILQTWLLLGMAALQVIAYFRRKPPLEAEFVSKAELNTRLDAINRKLETNRFELSGKMDGMTQRLDDVVREIGEVTGELKRIPHCRAYES